ncbi:MAG: FecR domain-containing protein [Spirochaetales bacterium]|nr:FecR domain-containing protein [Spirochaetales bacterium]
MKIKSYTLLILLLISLPLAAQTQNTKAVILYLEGTVDISRNGDYLDWADVDMGTEIENYDLVETGIDGYVEIEVSTPVSPGVIVKIQPDTAFYYDTKKMNGSTRTSFELLAGSMGMKVQKLYNDSELEVQVNSSVMGVRGTEFMVTSTVDGSTLVTTTEGRVSCQDDSGEEWFSTPGTVCQTTDSGKYREVAVPVEEVETYRKNWQKERMDILRSNLTVSLNHYTELYNNYYNRFDRSWRNLESKDDIFKKWSRYLINGTRPSLSEAVLSKQSISREIMELRSVLPIFQHAFYVLEELGEAYNQGYGQDISRQRKSLMNHYFDNYRETRRRLTKSLFYFRIYLEMGKRITNSDFNSEGLLDVTSGSNMLMGPPTPNAPF